MSQTLIDEFTTAAISHVIAAAQDRTPTTIDDIVAECTQAHDAFEAGATLTQVQTTKLLLEDIMRELIDEIKSEIKLEILTQVHFDISDLRADIRANTQTAPKKTMMDAINEFSLRK